MSTYRPADDGTAGDRWRAVVSGGMGTSEHRRPSPQDLATLSTETTLHGAEPLQPREGGQLASLVVIAGTPIDIGTHVRIDSEIVIGRVGAGLTLRDGRISRRHARIWQDDEGWWAEDLGSTNGTALEGAPLVQRTPIRDGAKLALGSTIVKFALIDRTEEAWLQQMTKLAGTDPLTGLHATHRFDHLLADAVQTARATKSRLAVLMMDLDGLKPINDRHGHRFGAHTIATVGTLLGEAVAGKGEATRFGGDEFCVFLPSVDEDQALSLAESFRARIEALGIELDGVTLRVTISIGLTVREAPDDPSALVVAADEALYRAKAQGKNRVSR